MSPLEIAAVVITTLAIWLTARRHMLCWPLNLIACALYFKVFLDVRLYADMGLQVLFGVGIVYGWIVWARGKAQDGTVTVMPLAPRAAGLALAVGAFGAGALGWLTSHYTNAALPWLDSTLTAFSLVAQYWTARRHSANWLLWIALDVVYVAMYVMKALYLTAGLYAALTGLAVLGWRRWHVAGQGQGDF